LPSGGWFPEIDNPKIVIAALVIAWIVIATIAGRDRRNHFAGRNLQTQLVFRRRAPSTQAQTI
jgi:hypothetical protein